LGDKGETVGGFSDEKQNALTKGAGALNGIKLVFALVCEDVRFEVNGKISIIGEGNVINLPRLPLTLPLCVLTKWSGSPGSRGKVSLAMITPDSTAPVNLGSQQFELGSADSDICYGGTVHKLPWQVHSTGVHELRIFLDGEEAGSIELVIKHQQNGMKN
jgi:hypothetical protein